MAARAVGSRARLKVVAYHRAMMPSASTVMAPSANTATVPFATAPHRVMVPYPRADYRRATVRDWLEGGLAFCDSIMEDRGRLWRS